jgi:hypothetical protein
LLSRCTNIGRILAGLTEELADEKLGGEKDDNALDRRFEGGLADALIPILGAFSEKRGSYTQTRLRLCRWTAFWHFAS